MCLGSPHWLQSQDNKSLCKTLVAHTLQIGCMPLVPDAPIKPFSDRSALISRVHISLSSRQPLFEETRLSTSTPVQSDFFTRAVTAIAFLGPMLLVIIAGSLPQGMRGDLIVNGHMFVAAALATALALRGVYGMGFSHAHKLLTSSPRRYLSAPPGHS